MSSFVLAMPSAQYLDEAKDDIIKKYNLYEISDRLTKALNYNQLNRDLLGHKILIPTYKDLTQKEHLNGEELNSIHSLGWCVELIFMTFVINDDILDNSSTRFGRPCWHKVQNIGMNALNDSLIFENLMYYLLRKQFGKSVYYLQLLEDFHEVMLITSCGQCLDTTSSLKSVRSFTMETYRNVTTTKAAYCAFYLPFVLAMHLAGIKNPEAFQQVKSISLELGFLVQAQNDLLDCFGKPEVTGKIGTDIQENKCSWLAVECMQRASEEQKLIMEECYGKNDPKMVQCVKDLYNSLDLVKVYADLENDSMEKIRMDLENATSGVPRKAIIQILDAIRKCNLF
ncbi:uncharacterized protein LOC142224537 [Haematobia irritans]|uniref:uncharacterized protein LOC142224537 n=1 Tax=Haematobia irritans TaxID=7368 RepID=UPI003F4FB67B